MKVIKIISIINQGGEYSITTTYNEVDDNGAIVKRNVKAPTTKLTECQDRLVKTLWSFWKADLTT